MEYRSIGIQKAFGKKLFEHEETFLEVHDVMMIRKYQDNIIWRDYGCSICFTFLVPCISGSKE